jgi:protein-disulfide isomerase
MTPIVDGLEREFEGQLTVIRLDANVAANERLQLSYGMRGHPTLLVLNEAGDVSAQFIGRQTAETLREAMTAVSSPTTP